MKIYRKLIVFFTAAVCAASCLDDGPTTSLSYILNANFEGTKVLTTDSLYFDRQSGVGFCWGQNYDLAFHHKLNSGKTELEGGFIVSWLEGKGEDKKRFRVNSGVGVDSSYTYVVYYENPDITKMPEYDIVFMMTDYGSCIMEECYVNNTKEVVEAVQSSFEKGDKLSLKMTGYLNGKKTDSQEIVLAEYKPEKDTVMTAWSKFPLDKLKDVDYIDIEINSTKENIPKAFCMDNLRVGISIEY